MPKQRSSKGRRSRSRRSKKVLKNRGMVRTGRSPPTRAYTRPYRSASNVRREYKNILQSLNNIVQDNKEDQNSNYFTLGTQYRKGSQPSDSFDLGVEYSNLLQNITSVSLESIQNMTTKIIDLIPDTSKEEARDLAYEILKDEDE